MVLTGVGHAAPPAQAVEADGGALGEAVGAQGRPSEGLHGGERETSPGL